MEWMQLRAFSGSLNVWLKKRVSSACVNAPIGGDEAGHSFSFLAEEQGGGRSAGEEKADIFLPP